MRRIEIPSDRADQWGNMVIVIPDDPEVTISGTRASTLDMASTTVQDKPRIRKPKRNKARVRMARNSRKRNR